MPVQILIFGNLVSDLTPALVPPVTTEKLLNVLLPTIKAIVGLGAGMLIGGYVAQCSWVLSGETQVKVTFSISSHFSFGYLKVFYCCISWPDQCHRHHFLIIFQRIRQLYVHSILRQDMEWFDRSEEGSLNTRLANDTQLIQDAISEKAGATIQSISQFITGLIVAFVKGWRLALVILACIPILGRSRDSVQ